ncbi:cyclase [Tritrichomonas foetus]|uniref:Cyclase n=1 Tax=Tritrichomonas foetus TaxID=1144522 RepID=A0A1J4KC28_9EUKA|nr:cyclase [Tritrichomonas foetus]|eukprot:OHT08522.1 cyclase [Tritrichomonas foetus]
MTYELWNILDSLKSPKYKWVDLSYPVSAETPFWHRFNPLKAEEKFHFDPDGFRAIEYTVISQYGTHVDPPCHFYSKGRNLDEIGLNEMVLPLCVIDAVEKTTTNCDYELTVDDIKEYEKTHGEIPAGCFVAMRTDWGERKYKTFDNHDDEGKAHYPGWSIDALKFLIETRKVTALGHETSDTDSAAAQEVHGAIGEYYVLEQGIYQIELLRNLKELPPKGAIIFCTWPNIKDGVGFTARCFACTPA